MRSSAGKEEGLSFPFGDDPDFRLTFDDADIAFMLGDAPLLCSIVPVLLAINIRKR